MTDHSARSWEPSSWRDRPVEQQVTYPDTAELDRVLERLGRLPPLVTSWETERLKQQLAKAAVGERFLLQGGDCCEDFEDCDPDIIARKLKVLLQMSLVLVFGSGRRLINVGRFAGQYAKPRSSDTQTRDGKTLPSFRGSNVNRLGFTEDERRPDPQLLLRGYEHAALTLNFIRGLGEGGFSDLHHPEQWNLDFASESPNYREYQDIVRSIGESIHFVESIVEQPVDRLRRVTFYTSHEALLLPYEEALTRQVPRRSGWYNLGTHFPWIGERTRDVSNAHVEYFRGLANPIAVKIGPTIEPAELLELIATLNPDNEPGRLTLLYRFGAKKIDNCLPPLVEAVQGAGHVVLWCCDPMHGNTVRTKAGVKTRYFDDIMFELDRAITLHQATESVLGGVHLELTGDDITECLGGSSELTESDLSKRYKTQVDPRLNFDQALEISLLLAHRLGNRNP